MNHFHIREFSPSWKFSVLLAGLFAFIAGAALTIPAPAQSETPSPPEEPVKLVFIHHSVGEGWLTDDHGGLARALQANNYFVSDTNYGWGPDSIGDMTDIPDWLEWFRGSESDRYLSALYNENGINSPYQRTLPDPGGENQIILFKSCFPNSELDGNPNDPPGDYANWTVSGAKYVYNELLKYFIARPDKLFVVITAPPVIDPTYGENARAFNTWLVQDWLAENEYPYHNVAVWDFYNVLTDPNNHHRYINGQIEYITDQGGDTAAYPDGDPHPTSAGDRKATEEFLPLLNIFYHRWQENAPLQPPPVVEEAASAEEATPPPDSETSPEEPWSATAPTSGMIDDFEGPPPSEADVWVTFWDGSTNTSVRCVREGSLAYGGSHALQVDFDVTPNSWASCELFYYHPQDWSASERLSFYYRASAPALVFSLLAYSGDPDSEMNHFYYALETAPESVEEWINVQLPWDQLANNDNDLPFDPLRAHGIAFTFDAYEDTPNTGTIWIDDLGLMGTAPPAAPQPEGGTTQQETEAQPVETAQEEPGSGRQICPLSTALVATMLIAAVAHRKRCPEELHLN